jgi:glutathione S-transferase
LLRFHDYVLSDSCYKVRLLLGLLGLDHVRQPVDYYPGREHLQPPFRTLSPLGEMPVIEDDGLVLWGPEAILCHLANTHDRSGKWLPRDAQSFGPVMMWVAFSAGPLHALSSAREAALFGAEADLDAMRQQGRAALRVLEDHLTERGLAGGAWIVGETATIADIAAFPAVALSHDCGIGLEDYPALNLWQRRMRSLPGFVSMPGIPDYF